MVDIFENFESHMFAVVGDHGVIWFLDRFLDTCNQFQEINTFEDMASDHSVVVVGEICRPMVYSNHVPALLSQSFLLGVTRPVCFRCCRNSFFLRVFPSPVVSFIFHTINVEF
jgi:hypothetical protein